MDMNRGATAIAAAVTICIAGCATGPTYVPPAEGEPQATIRDQHLEGFPCTDAHLSTLDDQILPFRLWVNAPRSIPISPGPHIATIKGAYGTTLFVYPFLPPILLFSCKANCGATLQFTAEPSHAYQLVLAKEGEPYRIDLIDSETNQSVANGTCPGAFQTGKKPQAPDSGTDEGAKDKFLKQ